MSGYWFKPKKYGWGLSLPIAWQGWASLACFVGVVLFLVYVNGLQSPPGQLPRLGRFAAFFLEVIFLSFLFCFIMKNKVEGGLKWRGK